MAVIFLFFALIALQLPQQAHDCDCYVKIAMPLYVNVIQVSFSFVATMKARVSRSPESTVACNEWMGGRRMMY
jgi:hypothetical protein